VSNPEETRKILVEMVQQARQLGETLRFIWSEKLLLSFSAMRFSKTSSVNKLPEAEYRYTARLRDKATRQRSRIPAGIK